MSKLNAQNLNTNIKIKWSGMIISCENDANLLSLFETGDGKTHVMCYLMIKKIKINRIELVVYDGDRFYFLLIKKSY